MQPRKISEGQLITRLVRHYGTVIDPEESAQNQELYQFDGDPDIVDGWAIQSIYGKRKVMRRVRRGLQGHVAYSVERYGSQAWLFYNGQLIAYFTKRFSKSPRRQFHWDTVGGLMVDALLGIGAFTVLVAILTYWLFGQP